MNASQRYTWVAAVAVLALFFVAAGLLVFLKTNIPLNTRGPDRIGLFGQPCAGSGAWKLNTFPLDPNDIELIVPMGRVQDSHVTPTDHQYIIPKGATSNSLVAGDPGLYEIKAPADGYIIQIELFREPIEAAYRGGEYRDNYLVLFEHSCDLYTRLIHIDTLSEHVRAAFAFRDPQAQHPYASVRIPVAEGETIGTVGPHSFDFQVMDAQVKNQQMISPDNIDHFSAYTVDTFAYVSDSLRSALLSRNVRQRTPLGGNIGYDRNGTLMGNWFVVGRDTSNREEYWTQNMSIVYDHIDESQIRVSLGNFDGYPKAFGVLGNGPAPESINKDSGRIIYTLAPFDYFGANGTRWDQIHFVDGLVARNAGEPVGVVLLELLDDRILKVEVFPGKTAAQVSGFTSEARLYER